MRTREVGERVTPRIRVSCAYLAALAIVACGRPSPESVTLPSGRAIQILGTGQMFFTSGERALSIKYKTTVDLDNVPAASAEADELWGVVKPRVSGASITSAVLQAEQTTSSRFGGLFRTSRGYNFVMQRNVDGTWPSHIPTSDSKGNGPRK